MKTSVQNIVAEVLRRLREEGFLPEEPPGAAPGAMVIFTGSWGAAAEAAAQIRSLTKNGVRLRVLASPGASRVLGVPYLAQQTGCPDIVEPAQVGDPFQAVAAAQVVVLPTLTQNTAAKIALGIRDTMTTELVALALLAAKPVVACGDSMPLWPTDLAALGCSYPSPAYMELTADHRRRLETLGVRFVPAGRLAAEVMAVLRCAPSPPARGPADTGRKPEGRSNRRVITERDVLAALAGGQTQLVVPPGIRITPLARDTARQRGVALVEAAASV